jgi:hypothetical protein
MLGSPALRLLNDPGKGLRMGELVSFRKARKAADRRRDELRAAENRVVHGRTKAERTLASARTEKARRNLDAQRIETGEER